MEEQEEWKDILGYEGLYQVSSFGRVKSLKRETKNQHGKEDAILPLRTVFNNKYYSVPLSKYGDVVEHNVHILVAIAFLDFTPCGLQYVIDHKDNVSLNNRADNLQIITQRQNLIKEIDKSQTYSKYTGVTYHVDRNKYYATIKFKRTSIHLGTHTSNQKYLRDLYTVARKYRKFYLGDPEEFRSFVHYMYIEEGYQLIDKLVTINLKDMSKTGITTGNCAPSEQETFVISEELGIEVTTTESSNNLIISSHDGVSRDVMLELVTKWAKGNIRDAKD